MRYTDRLGDLAVLLVSLVRDISPLLKSCKIVFHKWMNDLFTALVCRDIRLRDVRRMSTPVDENLVPGLIAAGLSGILLVPFIVCLTRFVVSNDDATVFITQVAYHVPGCESWYVRTVTRHQVPRVSESTPAMMATTKEFGSISILMIIKIGWL